MFEWLQSDLCACVHVKKMMKHWEVMGLPESSDEEWVLDRFRTLNLNFLSKFWIISSQLSSVSCFVRIVSCQVQMSTHSVYIPRAPSGLSRKLLKLLKKWRRKGNHSSSVRGKNSLAGQTLSLARETKEKSDGLVHDFLVRYFRDAF